MTDYKSIKGQKVQNFTTDPENPVVDQVWYNETLGDLKIRKTSLGSAWSSAAPVNTARYYVGGAQTSAIAAGGYTTVNVALAETWNGSAWTEVGDLNTARRELNGAADVNTAALAFGGNPPSGYTADTESWNGSAWTEVNNMNTARAGAGAAGNSASVDVPEPP